MLEAGNPPKGKGLFLLNRHSQPDNLSMSNDLNAGLSVGSSFSVNIAAPV